MPAYTHVEPGTGRVTLSRGYDEAGHLTHAMCCLCFDIFALDDLYKGSDGIPHDVCSACEFTEAIARFIISLMRLFGQKSDAR